MSEYKLVLLRKLKHFKIPESEYCFDGEIKDNCLGVEEKENIWEVYKNSNGKKTVIGIFYNENAAYNFLFFLVMKKHVNIKKRWW